MGLTRRWLFYTLILVYGLTLCTLTLTLTQGAIKLKKDHFFSFRWLFYTLILVYGFQCLWRKPWFWNIRHCWYDYPYHQVKEFSLSPIHQHNGSYMKSFSQFKKKLPPKKKHNLFAQIDSDVWVYYMVELSFYWSLSIR